MGSKAASIVFVPWGRLILLPAHAAQAHFLTSQPSQGCADAREFDEARHLQ